MANNNNTLLNKVLIELQSLRRDVTGIQHTLIRMEYTEAGKENSSIQTNNSKRTARSRSSSITPRSTPPARRLLQQIADRPIPKICWYHRTHGLKVNPGNCPGAPECSFDMAKEIQKMKDVIAKYSLTSTIQERIPLARQAATSATITQRIRTTPKMVSGTTLAPFKPKNRPTSTTVATSKSGDNSVIPTSSVAIIEPLNKAPQPAASTSKGIENWADLLEIPPRSRRLK